MTRVDFYVLPVAEPHGRLSFACRIAEKAWAAGHRVYLHLEDDAEARALDEMLWTFRAASFVPHTLAVDTGAPADCPVVIGTGNDPGDHHEVLVNLGTQVPEFFGRFQRVAEVVLSDPEARAASRRRWSYYKDRGYTLEHHDMQHMRGTRER
jgi:DNA polymerase-3 subunit chi